MLQTYKVSRALNPAFDVDSFDTSPITNSFIIFLILDLVALVRSSTPGVTAVDEWSPLSVARAGLPLEGPEGILLNVKAELNV